MHKAICRQNNRTDTQKLECAAHRVHITADLRSQRSHLLFVHVLSRQLFERGVRMRSQYSRERHAADLCVTPRFNQHD